MTWLFLLAYACSGLAGLIYEVSWTRLLTLSIGHTTAAASAVVAAFLGGLAIGAGGGAFIAPRLAPRQALYAYIALEVTVGVAALLLPLEVSALTPLLRWAYRNGDPGLLFPIVRLLASLLMVLLPAAALGATFPMAIRWFANRSDDPARSTGVLYAINTAGAAIGALIAGFALVPAIGLSATTRLGVAASALAALSVFALLQLDSRRSEQPVQALLSAPRRQLRPNKARSRRARSVETAHDAARLTSDVASGFPPTPRAPARLADQPPLKLRRSAEAFAKAEAPYGREGGSRTSPVGRLWLVGVVLGLSGFAALVHEITWTRILSVVLGPTIYAFAATLAAVIAGVACGSAIGTWVEARTRRPAAWLALALGGAAITSAWTSTLAGGYVPRLVAEQMASGSHLFGERLWQGTLLTAALILPTALCLGAAFPLALSTVSDREQEKNASRFGFVYALNTLGAVCGSLAAGFILIPWLGLQSTLIVVNGCLIAATLIVSVWGRLTRVAQGAAAILTAAACGLIAFAPSWDRDLVASGAYLYASYVPKDLELETLLKAGTLLYYREGAGSTVSVKRLTGTTTLAVDGKVDASNRADMLTQKLLAHLPLLLHDDPHEICIIGLGSGVTVGSALAHPITRVDVVEISPEVVEASEHFVVENHHALDDPRTHLIVGDGRSHLLLSKRQYDVIISEPSNPWIAGVAALFTREFFLGARDRLAPGGVICQWAHTYNISDGDLRSIVKTFTSVFPDGTAWLVGTDDVLLVASNVSPPAAGGQPLDIAQGRPLDARLANIARHWNRPGVAADLKDVSAIDPFSILSLFAGGPEELARYSESATILTDDRMTLEFSGPRQMLNAGAEDKGTALAGLIGSGQAGVDAEPERGGTGASFIRAAKAAAGAAEWRNRAAMMAKSDVHAVAYDDYIRALTIDPTDGEALEGLVRTASLSGRASDALSWVKGLTVNRAETLEVLVATSKLLAASGFTADALDTALRATRLQPMRAAALEQLASLVADAGDTAALDPLVKTLQRIAPESAGTYYYAAVAAFLRDRVEDAARLAERAIAIDPTYAPVYDLVGAAYTKLDQPARARDAFQASLRFDAHDSTAYTNLGLLELAAGQRPAAASYFAEALSLTPNSAIAREGLARTK